MASQIFDRRTIGIPGTVTPEAAAARDDAVAARDRAESFSAAALASADTATAAKNDALDAKVAAQAVGSTNDAIMASVANDDSSQFSTVLKTTAVTVSSGISRSLLVPGNRALRPGAQEVLGFFGAPGHGWSGSSGVTDMNAKDQAIIGTQAIKLSGTNSTVYAQKNPMPAFSIKQKSVRLAFRYTGDVTGIVVYFASDTGFANRVQRQMISVTQYSPDTDYVVDMPAGAFLTTAGNPNIEAMVMCRIIGNFGPGGGTLWLGGISLSPITIKPMVTFSFDDSASDHYNKARVKMNQYGFPGTLYPTISSIGATSDNITLAQMKHLYDVEGWEVGYHAISTAYHTDHTGKTEAWLREHFEGMMAWNSSHGFVGGTHAWPNTVSNPYCREIAGQYFTTSRGGMVAPETLPPSMSGASRAYNCGTQTKSDVKAAVDAAVSAHGAGWVHLFFHRIPITKVDANDVSIADFNEIVDHVAASGAKVVTAAQAMQIGARG